MKRKHLLYAIAIAVFTLSSCDSLLEEENFGHPTEGEILANENNIILLVGQSYAEIKWLHDHWGYWGLNTLTSDEAVNPVRMPGSHWSDGGYWRGMNTQDWDADTDAFEYVWNQSVSGAVLCNKTLNTLTENQDIISEDIYNQYVGELEVLRSFYYYTLFDCFGRIPYTEVYTEEDVPLMEPADVWVKLVENLEKNAPNLPIVTDANRTLNYGRVTQGFAYALLARLYLNAKSYGVTTDETQNYTKCIEACNKVIESHSYTIESDFFTNFKIYNESSKENIFVIVEDGNADFDYRDIGGKMANKLRITMLSLHYSHQAAWDMIEKPWNGFCAPPDFINRYADNDVRGPGVEGNGTLNTGTYGWFVGPIYNAAGTAILKDENGDEAIITKEVNSMDAAGWGDGARLQKYEIDKEKRFKFCENDFVLFRYADVLYMKAEAILRGGSGADIGTLLNDADFRRIRSRAGVTLYTSITLDELLDERGREFAWENVRRRDLIRYGQFAEGTWFGKEAKDATRNWFPIPKPILEKSPRSEDGSPIWTQNAGYN